MAALCWLAVTLALFLSAGNTLAAVDQNQLAGIVNNILNRFRPSYRTQGGNVKGPMFSVAVAVPLNTKTNRFDMTLVPDDGQTVRNSITQDCAVYEGQRVVAATVLRWPDVLDQCPNAPVPWPDVLKACGKQSMTWADVQTKCPNVGFCGVGRADHAEYRTLQSFNSLVSQRNENDLLVLYVYASPCGNRCANPDDTRNILTLIQSIKGWKNYVFVFSKVFKPRDGSTIPDSDLKKAVSQVGDSIGLGNIFRCDGSPGSIACTSCSTNNDVTPYCYTDAPISLSTAADSSGAEIAGGIAIGLLPFPFNLLGFIPHFN